MRLCLLWIKLKACGLQASSLISAFYLKLFFTILMRHPIQKHTHKYLKIREAIPITSGFSSDSAK